MICMDFELQSDLCEFWIKLSKTLFLAYNMFDIKKGLLFYFLENEPNLLKLYSMFR
ncbi:hypothetical protein Syun_014292 [Stephania yunnanensis]|uniref:Uncharacterized protein n=1 Tax=Stephania yunnanensis TaxID=152371 RepID=A0AAP0P8L9_9MAGN